MINEYCYYISCLLGIFTKIYDDFSDLHIKDRYCVKEFSKIVIVITSFLLMKFYNILSIIIFVSLFISNYCKKFDKSFWNAYMYFVGLIMFYFAIASQDKIKKFNEYMSYKLLFVLFVPVNIYFEEISFVEEFSKNKMIARIRGIIINMLLVLILDFFNIIENNNLHFFVALILFINTYFITNIIIHLFHTKYIKGKKQKVKSKKRKVNDKNKFKQ